MDSVYLQERIAATKAIIEAYEDAVLQLASGAIVSYRVDTGQSVQTVTKSDVTTLERRLDVLYTRLNVLELRLNGGGTVHVTPAW